MKRFGLSLSLWLFLILGAHAVPPEQVRTQVLTEGYGNDTVEVGDTATVSYILRLAGGEIVDASPQNKPLVFEVGSQSVVAGFSQGLVGMKTGEAREVTVPPSLGYGFVAVGPIPPNSTLKFEIKLVRVDKSAKADRELSEIFGRDGFGSRPSAQELDRPAVFEYLIRDFFTRPWRYPDAAGLIWKTNGVLTGVAFLLLMLVLRLPSSSTEED